MRTELNRARTETQTKGLEIARMQQHTEMLSVKHAEARDLCHQLQGQAEVVAHQRAALERRLGAVGRRCRRAEALAASFEARLRSVRPDLPIDYSAAEAGIDVPEPSARLNDALATDLADDNDAGAGAIDNHDLGRFLKQTDIE